MPHRFVIMIEGELRCYEHYDDIPDQFDHVIEFLPEVPPGPHTLEQHQEIDAWNDRLKRLMEIENASSNQSR